MFDIIGEKQYSYSFDDTQEDTTVIATLQGDDSTGSLRLQIVTNKVGPYISGGRSKDVKNFNVGTVQKPNLGEIRTQTAKRDAYHGFPASWHGFNGGEYKNVSTMIFDWMAVNMKGNDIPDENKRKQISDKLKDLTGEELDKIRKMLRLASALKAGDICTVDKAAFELRTPETVKILKRILKEGNGKVVVEDTEFGYAYVFAHNNPVSRMMGGVKIPEKYLKVVGHKTASKLIRLAQEMERIASPYKKEEGKTKEGREFVQFTCDDGTIYLAQENPTHRWFVYEMSKKSSKLITLDGPMSKQSAVNFAEQQAKIDNQPWYKKSTASQSTEMERLAHSYSRVDGRIGGREIIQFFCDNRMIYTAQQERNFTWSVFSQKNAVNPDLKKIGGPFSKQEAIDLAEKLAKGG